MGLPPLETVITVLAGAGSLLGGFQLSKRGAKKALNGAGDAIVRMEAKLDAMGGDLQDVRDDMREVRSDVHHMNRRLGKVEGRLEAIS